MTREDKQLLLKDLFARLPYGVNLYIEDSKKLPDNEHISVGFIGGYALNKDGCQDFSLNDVLESLDNGSIVKPYLRPMSSITKEEKKEYESFFSIGEYSCGGSLYGTEYEYIADSPDDISQSVCLFDWLNSHHFDYRGLIEEGLALEAPKGMY